MKVTLNWLQEHVNITIPVDELAERLTMAGLEVEGVVSISPRLENVMVGKIQSIQKHPHADNLFLCEVDVGKSSLLSIVCGARNIAVDQRVPVALPGAVLPGGSAIKKAKIRGVHSEGMICSEKELDLGDDASGILVLPPRLTVGKRLEEAVELCDTVLDIEVTPNRPDCLSVRGIAREIAAITGKPLKRLRLAFHETAEESKKVASVEIKDFELCPRYTARVLKKVTITPSPLWLRLRLERTGYRGINNVVDITNYVLAEYGHPLHAFDFKLLSGGKIVVRRAKPDETIVSLDGIERKLDETILVIADVQRPVAIAGIMGGEGSGVTAQTGTVLLESAYFHPPNIRASSKKLGLESESSYRFERGADPLILPTALDRTAQLMTELGGGKVLKGVIDVYKSKRCPRKVSVRIPYLNKLLGTEIHRDEVVSILDRLELKCSSKGSRQQVEVLVPTFRVDVTKEVDLIEEVARIYGYDNITPSSMANIRFSSLAGVDGMKIRSRAKQALQAMGFYEVLTYSFMDEKSLKHFSQEEKIKSNAFSITNPISEDLDVLRTTLIPSMLNVVQNNYNRDNTDLSLFELGKVFSAVQDTEDCFKMEREFLCFAMTGKKQAGVNWKEQPQGVDYYDLKGAVAALLSELDITDYIIKPCGSQLFHPFIGSELIIGSQTAGLLGELKEDIARHYGLKAKVYICEIDFCIILQNTCLKKKYVTIPKFPPVKRDIAIVLNKEVSYERIMEVLSGLRIEILEDIRLFDLYEGPPIPAGKKSVAFSLRFGSQCSTLNDKEVDTAYNTIKTVLSEKLGCTIRE